MAGSKVNAYAIGDVDLTSLMETVDRQRRGYQALSLTNFSSLLEPKIASGSLVEVSGALFKFEVDESITGWSGIANSNEVYIKLVPAGSSITAVFTTTAPVWSDAKQGFYSTNDRYIGGLFKDGSGNYSKKWLYEHVADSAGKVLVKDLAAEHIQGRNYNGTYFADAGVTENAIFDALAPCIPNVGDIIPVSGALGSESMGKGILTISCAKRDSATKISLQGIMHAVGLGVFANYPTGLPLNNGTGTAPTDGSYIFSDAALAW